MSGEASSNDAGGSSSTLSFWAIVVIAANTMNGPGLTTLPAIAQSAGLLTYVILVVLATSVTSYVVRRLCLIMWTTHKDQHHHGPPQLDESDIVALSGEAWRSHKGQARRIASIAMVGCALALALAQMMLCAKIADAMIVAFFGSACGINPIGSHWIHCTSNLSMKPFTPSLIVEGTEEMMKSSSTITPPMTLITAGLVIASSITISLASVDQSSMMMAQYVLFGCLLLACMRFCGTLHHSYSGNDEEGHHQCQAHPNFFLGSRPFDAVGPVLFNFAFVVTAPPLSCGAAHGMREAMRALTTATIIMGSLYIVIGWIGAPAAACIDDGSDTNLLSLVLQNRRGTLDILSVIVFGLSQLAAIPVYCELARETMDSHVKIVSAKSAFRLCHVAPWIICAVTYNSELFESFVEWSSLLLLGFCNFSLPLLLDLMINDSGVQPNGLHHWKTGQGSSPVLWVYSLVSASIAAVIIQRMTESLLLAEGAFMTTVLLLINYH